VGPCRLQSPAQPLETEAPSEAEEPESAKTAAALGRLLTSPEERVRLAGHARRHVEAFFNIDRNAARLRDLFSACSRPPEPTIKILTTGTR